MFLLTANCYVGRNSVEVDCCFYSFATPLTPRSSGDTRAATTIRWWKRWSRTRRIKWRRFRQKQLKSREAMIDGVKLMVSVTTLGDGRRVALVGRSNSCRWQRIRWRIGDWSMRYGWGEYLALKNLTIAQCEFFSFLRKTDYVGQKFNTTTYSLGCWWPSYVGQDPDLLWHQSSRTYTMPLP